MHPVLFHLGPVFVPSYGAVAAIGVLVALMLAQRTARTAGLAPQQLWNLIILALFVAMAGARLVLVAVNWTALRTHPAWLLALAMMHHPLIAAIAAALAVVAACVYARRHRMDVLDVADALAAPVALGLACEQIGALLAGSGFGTETAVRWAVTYTSPLAARWSDAPLFVPVHPVQAYAAIAFFTIALVLLTALPVRNQRGDIAGLALLLFGAAIYGTEFWRDPDGRGALLGGALTAPQLAAIVFVLASALLLRTRSSALIVPVLPAPPVPPEVPHV